MPSRRCDAVRRTKNTHDIMSYQFDEEHSLPMGSSCGEALVLVLPPGVLHGVRTVPYAISRRPLFGFMADTISKCRGSRKGEERGMVSVKALHERSRAECITAGNNPVNCSGSVPVVGL